MFFSRNQLAGEPFDNFLMDLKRLVRTCDFGEQEERMIRDRIVIGIADKGVQKKLLEVADLNLTKTIEICRTQEVTQTQTKHMQRGSSSRDDITAVDKLSIPKPSSSSINNRLSQSKFSSSNNKANYSKSTFRYTNHRNLNNSREIENNKRSDKNCNKCQQKHAYRQCPAYGQVCNNCNRKNHFAVACNLKKVRELTSNNIGDDFYIDMLKVKQQNQTRKSWFQKVRIQDSLIEFKLDTGAEVNVLPFQLIKKFKTLEIKKCETKLEAYGGSKLKTIGTVDLVCMARNEISVQNFIIVDANSVPILGLQGCLDLNLVRRIHNVNLAYKDKEEFVKNNVEAFEGLGCFKNNYHLRLKSDAKPVVKAARRIPFALVERFRAELKRLEGYGIIEKVEEPAEWVSNIVIVEKSNNSLRICLDPKDLNRALLPENYTIPSFEEITTKLANKKYFTVLDLKDGYWQIKLDHESSKLCTFNTIFGCYRFKRLPFGISVAPELFQKYNEDNFSDIEGVVIYIDDLLISANSIEEHDKILMKVLNRAKQLNIKFNSNKIQFRVNRVKFLGHEISDEGITIDENKTKAITALEPPKNKRDLQKLLGFVNYMRKFVVNLSEISSPLTELLKKNSVFHWLPTHTSCLEKIKMAIINAPSLKAFNEKEEITLQVDASKDGIGSCLMQLGRPVYYSSRSLTNAETRYSQIEKELLAIVAACQKFHNFIYGRHFTVLTDHRPLLGVLKKDISQIPSPRLQRMAIRLLKYRFELKHIPGKEMWVADMLSRNYCKNEIEPEIKDLNEVIHTLNISDERIILFKTKTSEDSVLLELKRIIQDGWPNEKGKVREDIKPYWKLRNELFLCDDLIFVNDKLLVPSSLRTYVLKILHQAHLGIEKTKARARSLVYWPGINDHIEEMINKCEICQKYRPSNPRAPLLCHEMSEYPFFKIGLDICEVGRNNYLILVDYYSKYFEIIEIRNKTANMVINVLKNSFSIYGIPRMIMCDNMPFNSFSFKFFCQKYYIKLITSSPNYPRSNGLAERYVHIAKDLIRKAQASNEELWLALLEYRNTPLKSTNLSPVEMIMGRKTRTLLPVKQEKFKLKENTATEVQRWQRIGNSRNKKFYDMHTRSTKNFEPNDLVWVKEGKFWVKGIIQCRHSSPRSFLVKLENDKTYRRNISVLRKRV